MNEQTLRRFIRKEIGCQKLLLSEQGGTIFYDRGEFYNAFIGPWINVLKVIKNESQKTLANVKTSFQIFFTLNDKKAREIIAKNRDRVKRINADTESILKSMPMASDFAAAAFVMNPAGYLIGTHGPDFAKGSVEYLKGAGFGDFLPDESSYGAEKRKQDDKGPIGKALQGLEQIFLLAGATHTGTLISEQEEEVEEEVEESNIPPDLLLAAMEETGDLKKIKDLKTEMINSFFEGSDGINAIPELAKNQINFLNDIASSTNVEELNAGLQKFKTAAPEADLGDVAKLPETLKTDASNISKNAEAMEQITKQFLEEKGMKPTQEKKKSTNDEEASSVKSKESPEEEKINKEELQKYVNKIAFGQAMSSLQESVKTNIENIVQWAQQAIDSSVKDLIDGMKEAAPGIEINENDPEFKRLVSAAKSKISS